MTDQFQWLAEAARAARNTLSGMAGIAEGISKGDWDRNLTPQQVIDLADLLAAMSEQVRRSREKAGFLTGDATSPTYSSGTLDGLVAHGLPLNRKERFYTGTVLPMIIASDGFAHLHRFLALCGLEIEPLVDHTLNENDSIEFFTEYNFVESRFTDDDRARFPDAPTDADTPDLVIVGPNWLVAVEAKMFHNPRPSALNEQMRRQRILIDYWARNLHVPGDRIAHVLLLPSRLPAHGVSDKVVTWESVLDAYQVVGPAYWTAMLRTALRRYERLRSAGVAFGANADSRMTGAEIVEAHALGELDYAYIGRKLGLDGRLLGSDLDTGTWRYRLYEVRYEPLPGNPNWFAAGDFIARTAT